MPGAPGTAAAAALGTGLARRPGPPRPVAGCGVTPRSGKLRGGQSCPSRARGGGRWRRRSPRPWQDPELQTGACREEAEGRLTGSGLGRWRRRSAAAVEPGPPLSHPSGLRGRAEPSGAAPRGAGPAPPLLSSPLPCGLPPRSLLLVPPRERSPGAGSAAPPGKQVAVLAPY